MFLTSKLNKHFINGFTSGMKSQSIAMIGENQQLVTNEPVEIEK